MLGKILVRVLIIEFGKLLIDLKFCEKIRLDFGMAIEQQIVFLH